MVSRDHDSRVMMRRSVTRFRISFPALLPSKGAKRASDSLVLLATPAMRALRLQHQDRNFKGRAQSDPGPTVRQSTFYHTGPRLSRKFDTVLTAKPQGASEIRNASADEFIGPLAQLYPYAQIIKPVRFDEETWEEAMHRNERWPSHDATHSGLTTYWQAVLFSAHQIKGAIHSFVRLTKHRKLKKRSVETVALALGKLTNTIGLSWSLDHVANVSKKRAETDMHSFMNVAGIKHRHDKVLQKVWKVLDAFDNIQNIHDRLFESTQDELLVMVTTISSIYDDFYLYLIYTAQIVLENALFNYRVIMGEADFSCVGNFAYKSEVEDQTISCAEVIIVGATPAKQRHTRLRIMGYDRISAAKTIFLASRAYHRTFLKPLSDIISAAKRLDAQEDQAGEYDDISMSQSSIASSSRSTTPTSMRPSDGLSVSSRRSMIAYRRQSRNVDASLLLTVREARESAA